jgi:DeoR/GlpR family transcriptional regulator of sugar metabolism
MSRSDSYPGTTLSGSELRTRILKVLSYQWPNHISVSTLREQLGGPPSTTRRILNELRAAGVVERGAGGGWRAARPSIPAGTTRPGRPHHRRGLREAMVAYFAQLAQGKAPEPTSGLARDAQGGSK